MKRSDDLKHLSLFGPAIMLALFYLLKQEKMTHVPLWPLRPRYNGLPSLPSVTIL